MKYLKYVGLGTRHRNIKMPLRNIQFSAMQLASILIKQRKGLGINFLVSKKL